MSFTLNLGFGGLCLFVHDPDKSLMHVLLPKASDHLPTFVHDEESTGSSKPNGIARLRRLQNTLIDLTQIASTTALTPAPVQLADLGDYFKVPKKLVRDSHPGFKIASRITFRTGKACIAPCGEGAIWDWNGEEQQLAIRVLWEMEVDDVDNPLVIHRDSLNGSAGGMPISLEPYGGRLDIWVFNSPEAQLPHTLPPKTKRKGGSADHFNVFQTLSTSADTYALPTMVKEPAYDKDCYEPEASERGLDLTCIGARAPLGP